jgi:hypothetical protein
MTGRTVAFTHADSHYFRFVSPFIYFFLKTNHDVAVEVVVDNLKDYLIRHPTEIEVLRQLFPDRLFVVRDYLMDKAVSPGTRRFIDRPTIASEYTYIADIDIIALDNDITNQHVQNMEKLCLPYSNIKREGTKRLSGLHFSRTDSFYPTPDLSDIDLSNENDESVLYKIVERKGLPIPTGDFRPLHGIHTSLHRPPLLEGGNVHGWGISDAYLKKLYDLMSSDEFAYFEKETHPGYRNILDRLRSIIRTAKHIHISPATRAFTAIYKSNGWASPVSRSGPGSTWQATRTLRHHLRVFFQEFAIRSLVDAPCGDANWIVEALETIDYYIGIDIVEDIIASNAIFHAERNMSFRLGNITVDPLPKADAILCRDCLVHLPLEMGLKALRRFALTDAKYVLLTTFTQTEHNSDIPHPGPWRQLNLTKPPFNLAPPMRVISERKVSDPYPDKCIGIWRVSDLSRL